MPARHMPNVIKAQNDKGETFYLVLLDPLWWQRHLAPPPEEASPTSPARRMDVESDAIALLDHEDELSPVAQAFLCIDPVANEWWVEGIDKSQKGCFFLSEVQGLLSPLQSECVA